MPSFLYQAVRSGGERVSGEIEARTRAEATIKLEQSRLQPISLKVKEGSAESTIALQETSTSVPVSGEPIILGSRQIVQFTDELSDLLEAGLQLEPALRVMEQRRELTNLKHVVIGLRQRVRDGASFSSALHDVSPSFSDLYCKLISAGEMSGALPEILKRQAIYLTEMGELQSRVVQALIYPAILSLTGGGLLVVFMTVLVPQLTVLFSKTGQDLPMMTQVLIASSSFVGQWWWLILGFIVLSALSFWRYIETATGKMWWHTTQLRIPLVGAVIASRYYVQLTQTLATMISNGIPLLNALRLMHAATSNIYLHELLGKALEFVSEGGSLSRALQKVGHFPPTLIDMVAVGEQTGDLGGALEKTGKRYDKELNVKIQRLTSFVQPAVILVMAGAVGVVAYSMVTGIFQSVSGLSKH